MPKILRPLLFLHENAAFEGQIRRAVGRQFEVRTVGSWNALRTALRESLPNAVVVVDPYLDANDAGGLSPHLRHLLADFPWVAVVAAMETPSASFRDLRTLGAWGVVEVISLDQECTPEVVAHRVRSANTRPLEDLLVRALPSHMPGQALAILLTAAEIVLGGQHSPHLARTFFVSRRTLSRWCGKATLPPPRRLLAWMRILLAAELLDDTSRKISNIAYGCGYASDNAMRAAMRSFLDRTPRELRRAGAFATAVRAFREEIRMHGEHTAGDLQRTKRGSQRKSASPPPDSSPRTRR